MEFVKKDWDKVIDANNQALSFGLKNLWEYRDLIGLFVKRDYVVYFKQTVLGPLWYLIKPICSTIMNIIVFGTLAGLSTDGIPQVLFYFAGSMLWSFFSTLLLSESNIFNSNKAIFGKVYFPRLTAVISTALSELIKTGIQFVLFVILYFFYAAKGSRVGFSWKFVLIIPVILWITLLAIGIGLIISSITTKYRDIALTMNFFLSLLMYATPVVYPLSQISGKLRILFLINPASAPVESFRVACFGAGSIPMGCMIFSIIFTVICLVVGLLLFDKNEKMFIDVI